MNNANMKMFTKSMVIYLFFYLDLLYLSHFVILFLSGNRILDFVENLISSSKPSDMKFPPGVSAVAPELSYICGQFWKLISHNRSTFGPFYADIISELICRHDDVSH